MKNILIYSIGRSPEREKLFKWIDIISPYEVYFYKLKSRKDISIKNLEDAKKYRIGGVNNDIRTQYLLGKGFSKDSNIQLSNSLYDDDISDEE